MSAAWIMSASELLCSSSKSLSSSEKTRSHDAEFGEIAKTMRAASAHAGKRLPLTRHHLSNVLLSSTLALSKAGALVAAARYWGSDFVK